MLSLAQVPSSAVEISRYAVKGRARREAPDFLSIAVLDRLIGAIYEGPIEPMPWHAALQLLREALDAKHVTLILRPPSAQSAGAIINTDTVRLDATESYQTHFFAIDPFVALPEGQIVTPEELLGEAWRRTPLYHEYLRPLDVEHLIGADVRTPEETECRFRVARSREAPPFSARDKALCRFLLPHIRRSIQLHLRLDTLECERQLFAGVVERMQVGMVSYARSGAILEISPEARRILAQKDGLRLEAGTVCAENPQHNRELRRLLREALAGPTAAGMVEAISIERRSVDSPLCLMVRPVQTGPWSSGRQCAAVMYLRDPESAAPRAFCEIARRMYGLTRTEAALAQNLVEGATLDEAAARLELSLNTARTYLRHMFSKTGVARQATLVRLLLNNVTRLG
jgi:DNA-binding CsgD family transcriptional regulator